MPSLAELLPQAGSMLLLSGYRPQAADDSVEAYVDVSPDSFFYEPESGGVPACVALEYMSQAMALLVGLTRRRAGLPPRIGFVLGSRRMTVGLPSFASGRRYSVRATCVYQDESFGSFDCAMADPDGTCVASATLTAFQPEGEVTPETLKELS